MSSKKFVDRHIGLNRGEKNKMLRSVGYENLDEMMGDVVPKSLQFDQVEQSDFYEHSPVSEEAILVEMREMMKKNKVYRSMIGMGYYGCYTPSVIQRSLFENPGWYTQYTPYQSEISQGRLESLLNFQTMIGDLTALPFANASLLDEGTAAAEAMGMLHRINRKEGKESFFVSEDVHPYVIELIGTRAQSMGIDLVVAKDLHAGLDEKFFGLLLAYPHSDGQVFDYYEYVKSAKQKKIKVAVCTDLLALCLLKPPGEWGADVAVGNSQRFGVPMGFGGPHAAFLACTDECKRQMPGRIIGLSKDKSGKVAYRMAMQTREQHIRRDKATSNICTAQALLANMAAMYAVYHGPNGLREIAIRVHERASLLSKIIEKIGFKPIHNQFFDTLCYVCDVGIFEKIIKEADLRKINFRTSYHSEEKNLGGKKMFSISLDETTSLKDIADVISIFSSVVGKHSVSIRDIEKEIEKNNGLGEAENLQPELSRTSKYLAHPIFNTLHSEQKMQRYLTALERKDISLTFSMIPLGSCTMKLNATTQMMPLSFPEVGKMHPFAPESQTEGYAMLFDRLENYLKSITGFEGISLQPNSGAQGEYAGLLAIRNFLKEKGQGDRNIALIPSSAHGTNPASAVMAGFEVVVVKCLENGMIDLEDVKDKVDQYKETLGALMITYPSTYGVYEEGIEKVCQLIHDNGGQVYMDGANMNAQVGYTSPQKIGADVCHLNLHKTFAIPHGGGGPGVGPIGVAKHLVPFLPGHRQSKRLKDKKTSCVSSTPFGSASITTISYAYIRLLGQQGLRKATAVSILNANYMKIRLQEHYKILFKGKNGMVAHEMILDFRPFQKSAGILVEDVAKRLIDYGFHSPTMAWPVAGTMMIEPTESESKDELDRFCDALISIRKEIENIEKEVYSKEDNPLKNAPHTVETLCKQEWNHPYSREEAVFPLAYVKQNKFWPLVERVDNVYGDRNLICSCPPLETYSSGVRGT